MPSSRICHGVSKSGSPTPREIYIVHLAGNIKELPDTGRFNVLDFIRKWISHGVTSILSSLFFFAKIVPWSLYFFRMKCVAVLRNGIQGRQLVGTQIRILLSESFLPESPSDHKLRKSDRQNVPPGNCKIRSAMVSNPCPL